MCISKHYIICFGKKSSPEDDVVRVLKDRHLAESK